MKPAYVRALRVAMQDSDTRRKAALERTLRDGTTDAVVPELIPTEDDLVAAHAALRAALKQADRVPRGRARDRKMDKVLAVVPRVIYIERVLALDPLARAALTPGRLAVLALVDKRAMQRWHMQVTVGARVIVPGEDVAA